MGLYDLLLSNPWRTTVLGVIFGYVGAKIVEYIPLIVAFQYIPKQRKVEKYEKDVVYLHHWHHSWTRQVPNLSPYSIKLECWLRLKKVKYEVVETARFSKATKQIPYILFNGEEICESNNIINYLAEYFKIDLTDGLTPEQLASSRALQRMVEDSTSWTIFMDRYIYKPDLYMKYFRMAEPKFLYTKLQNVISTSFTKRSTLQGIGRQTREMVERTGKADVKAVTDMLGTKQFMMGDHITMADCTLFGHLCQVVYVDFPYFHNEAIGDNVRAYLDRVKDKLWPDWHQRVNPKAFDS